MPPRCLLYLRQINIVLLFIMDCKSPEVPIGQLTIRQFQPQDKEAALQVNIKALTKLGIPEANITSQDIGNAQEEYFNKNGDFLVGEVDGQIVAIGGYKQKDKETANIRKMRTLPEYQGKGIGRKMLEALEESIRRHSDYKKIKVGTSTIMPNAIRLYTSMGYKEVERIPKPDAGYGKDFAEIAYEKSIERE